MHGNIFKPFIKTTTIPLFFTAIFFFTGCSHEKSPDVSAIKIDLSFKRFEQDLFSMTSSNYQEGIDSLKKKYPVLFPFYFNQIGGWNITDETASSTKDSIWQYIHSPYSQALYDSTMKQFVDLSSFKKNLYHSFQYYRYYFPEAVIPEVNTVINAPPAFTIGDDILCISIDKYLGPSSSFYSYETEPVPQYILRRFRPEYMLSNGIEVLATGHFESSHAGKRLLDAMIYKGKVIFFKEKLLPASSDSIITGFREKDLDWCKYNEPEIWKFFIEHKLLYSIDPLEYAKYVNEGPNTSGMPPEAPGNIGSWIGWRIVSKYMEANPSVTLQQLMDDNDSQKILTGSKYKPSR